MIIRNAEVKKKVGAGSWRTGRYDRAKASSGARSPPSAAFSAAT
jgi:hypothetical protein